MLTFSVTCGGNDQHVVHFRAVSATSDVDPDPDWEIEFRPGFDAGPHTSLRFTAQVSLFDRLKQNCFQSINKLVTEIAKARTLEYQVIDGRPQWFLTVDLEHVLMTKWVFNLQNPQAEVGYWRAKYEETKTQLDRVSGNLGAMFAVSVHHDREFNNTYAYVLETKTRIDGISPKIILGKGSNLSSCGGSPVLLAMINDVIAKVSDALGMHLQPACILLETRSNQYSGLGLVKFQICLVQGDHRYGVGLSPDKLSSDELCVPSIHIYGGGDGGYRSITENRIIYSSKPPV